MNSYTVTISDGTTTLTAVVEAYDAAKAAQTFLSYDVQRFGQLDATQDWTIAITAA